MSTDALLTLAAAVIAILTLLSAEGREDLRLRFTWPLRGVALLAAVILTAIKLSPIWVASGLPTAHWRWGFDAELVSFVTISLATAIVVGGFLNFRLKPRRIEQFSRLAERLLFAEKYSELVFLLERHFEGIRRIAEGRDASSRLRKVLKPDDYAIFVMNRRVGGTETPEEWKRHTKKLTTRVKWWLADKLPNHDDRQRRARRLVERVFLSGSFVVYVSKARPDFALKVLDVEVPFFREGFVDLLVGAWMTNTNSVLYEETLQNQNMALSHRYRFTPLNPVLWYLFGGPFRAEAVAIHKPVGDFVLKEVGSPGTELEFAL